MNVADVAYLGLGANLGRRERTVEEALRRIAELPDTVVLRRSPLYETAPWGFHMQPPFINCVTEISTAASPARLLDRLRAMESDLGRAPAPRNHPRVIDIDILLFGTLRLDLPGLVLPHPRLALRRFVLQPLADLCPDLIPPGMTGTVAELLAACTDECAVAPWQGGDPAVSVA